MLSVRNERCVLSCPSPPVFQSQLEAAIVVLFAATRASSIPDAVVFISLTGGRDVVLLKTSAPVMSRSSSATFLPVLLYFTTFMLCRPLPNIMARRRTSASMSQPGASCVAMPAPTSALAVHFALAFSIRTRLMATSLLYSLSWSTRFA